MALRDKLAERAQPYLEPGEQVQAVFLAQTGPTPWFAALSALIVLLGAKYYVVVVTDRSILALRAGAWTPSKPKSLEARLPRATRIGPLRGLWGKSTLLGDKTHIHKRFHKDVEQADALLPTQQGYGVAGPAGGPAGAAAAPAAGGAAAPAGGTPAGWYPDPENPGGQRYFDGTTWTDQRA